MEMIEGMDKSLHSGRYETARAILEGKDTFIEMSGFWQDPETGIWLKIRPDLIATNKIIWDLKKFGSHKPFSWQAVDLHYDLQAYMMRKGVSILTGVEHEKVGFIVFHSKPPYPIEVLVCGKGTSDSEPEEGVGVFDTGFLDSGREKFDTAMATLSSCLKTDEWPGMPDEVQLLYPPKWRVEQLRMRGYGR